MTTLLIDISFLAHQARNTLGDLTDDNDMASGVVYGILTRLLLLATRFSTNQIVLCFDSRTSIRKQAYPDYKGNRAPLDEEDRQSIEVMHDQINALKAYLPECGFPCIEQDGLESDDMIAMLVRQAIQGGHTDDIIIVSNDGDLFQLLREHSPAVWMYDPTLRKKTTPFDLELRYGCAPSQWAKVKALGGCVSDNVKGVRGVKEKTAVKFLTRTLKPSTKIYATLSSQAASDTYNRNLTLVALPHAFTAPIAINWARDGHEFDRFLELAKMYGLKGVLEGDAGRRWLLYYQEKWNELAQLSDLPHGRVTGVRKAAVVDGKQTEGLGL